MTIPIDHRLYDLFSIDNLRHAYEMYKERKRDYFNPEKITISMGADGVPFEAFEKQLDRNIANISKRLLDGTYLFYPFREVDIPKPGGGVRVLSIASIRDVLVQQQLYNAVYPFIERRFRNPIIDHVSFAYRKGRSGPQSALYLHKYIKQGYYYALDADIVKYFDKIPHQKLLNVLANHIDATSLTFKMIRRFILTDRVPFKTYRNVRIKRLKGKEIFRKRKPIRTRRDIGVPQGGVLSGMLANLYLHEFDVWVMNELKMFADLQYVRYADDFVVLVKQEFQLTEIQTRIAHKLQEFELELHTDPNKTRLVDIRVDGIDFVGFHFTDSKISIRQHNIKVFKERFIKKLDSDTDWKQRFKSINHRLEELVLRKLNYKIFGVQDRCPICSFRRGKPKSWLNYFSITTDVDQLKELDKWIREQISVHFWRNYNYHVKRKDLKRCLGSLVKEYYSLRSNKICKCINESDDDLIF